VPLIAPVMANSDYESAILSGINHWLADTWIGAENFEDRYRGSISVCPTDPQRAVREIEEWGDHPLMVQVVMQPHYEPPLGDPRYHAIYEAAERKGLPIALHVLRNPGMTLMTPAGFCSYYGELHPQYSSMYIPHLVSFVMNGVFDRFPGLKLVMVEGGTAWAAPLMWRMDYYWREFGADLPIRRAPSEIVRDHVRFTTQPIEEPEDRSKMTRLLDWMDAGRTLIYSSDYPHWDFDPPDFTKVRLDPAIRDRVLATNAVELYGLPPERVVPAARAA
jgi:predicted TIM-barrel fold metal-dependent hydrolase